MKNATRQRSAIIAICLAVATLVQAATPKLPNFPPLQFKPPAVERAALDNGLVIFLLEDHELPLVKLQMLYAGGSQVDPLGKTGLGSLFGESMTFGGSALYTPEQIERTLNQKAATISFSIDLENGGGAMSCRKEDFDQVFGIFQDLALRPRFRKDKFDVAKSKALEGLRRLNDDPDVVARREFRRAMYGTAHAYARIPTPATIKALKREDLLAAHARFFRPNGTMIAISGDFVTAEMLAKLKSAFGSWVSVKVEWPEIAEPIAPEERRVYYIQRPLNQSQIRIGGIGLARHDPNHFAWEVFNELWGGSAGSMLFRTVRTEKGLAYSVGSGYSEPTRKGLVVAVSQTRGSQTLAAIQSMLDITKAAREAPFTDEEIRSAKEAIRNRFIENFASSAQIAGYKMNLEFFGYPNDYLDTYTERIRQVTREDLRRVGKAYLHPDKFSILVMGDLSTFDKPMSTLGKPKEIRLPDYSQED